MPQMRLSNVCLGRRTSTGVGASHSHGHTAPVRQTATVSPTQQQQQDSRSCVHLCPGLFKPRADEQDMLWGLNKRPRRLSSPATAHAYPKTTDPMAKLFLVTACTLLIAATAVSGRAAGGGDARGRRRAGQIVGGFAIDITDAPYQVALLRNGRFDCGGSIISPAWILTAAHCTHGIPTREISVRAGSSFRNRGDDVHAAEVVIEHPDYDPDSTDFDYALIELATPIELDGVTKKAIELQHEDDTGPEEDEHGLVSGWGATKDRYTSNRVLRATFVPVLAQSDCERAYSKIGSDLITDNMFVFGYSVSTISLRHQPFHSFAAHANATGQE
ncbi:hypothetical protein AND_008632 [Anopheles darlingi]|uniref:trypsin n=1 Tax=Anopheles darlingi TaxID=43151 RepID=W5J8R0_ANODA|nr:hypothetical protein AND_008632 [Anopheles darlingi]